MGTNHRKLISFVAIVAILGLNLVRSDASPLIKGGTPRLTDAAHSVPYSVFTIRYVLLSARPTAWSYREFKASGSKLPVIFQNLQNGAGPAMDTTPGAFVQKLKIAQTDHQFQLLLAGSVECVNESSAVIYSGPSGDPRQFTVGDNIFLSQNSPTTVLMRHTGAFTFTSPGETSRDATGWSNCIQDHTLLGRTYSQGVLTAPDGEKLVFAYCILPGRADLLASGWDNASTIVMRGQGVRRAFQ